MFFSAATTTLCNLFQLIACHVGRSAGGGGACADDVTHVHRAGEAVIELTVCFSWFCFFVVVVVDDDQLIFVLDYFYDYF